MKKILPSMVLALSLVMGISAQENSNPFEKYPVFPECADSTVAALPTCFNNTLRQFVIERFEQPAVVAEEEYSGRMELFFEVDKEGKFKLLYTDAIYQELKDEAKRIFELLPVIQPATYNGRPSYAQFTLSLEIPLEPFLAEVYDPEASANQPVTDLNQEYDAMEKLPYTNEEYRSGINIPLSHHNYFLFDRAMNQVGINNHTAQKPYTYSEVNKYYDFEFAAGMEHCLRCWKVYCLHGQRIQRSLYRPGSSYRSCWYF